MTPNPSPPQALHFDTIIIGGGIAGLWLLNRLVNEGYNAILFEQDALGTGQTIASQGMIHGGVKYTLAGALNKASEAIADMPDYWRNCLAGTDDIDLSQTQTLSEHFYMWSTGGAVSNLTNFFASKALRGRIDRLRKKDFPSVFSDASSFKGSIYRLVDQVIDTPSLLRNLLAPVQDRVFKIDWQQAQLNNDKSTVSLVLNTQAKDEIIINTSQFIFAAGKGNEALLKSIDLENPAMQIRPLQQVMVKHDHQHAFYAHCTGSDSTPRLTISSHPCSDGKMCWYLGGQLSEKGVGNPPKVLIEEAKTELSHLFPWLNWQDAQWATHKVDRAEPKQANLARPDNAFIRSAASNVCVAWPTKLTLAPNLGEETLTLFKKLNVKFGAQNSSPKELNLPTPSISLPPWETAEWQSA